MTIKKPRRRAPRIKTLRGFLRTFKRLVKESPNYKCKLDMSLIRVSSKKKCYCPITFVVKKLTNKNFEMNAFYSAAKEIGLPDGTTAAIVSAADNNFTNYPEVRKSLQQSIKD